MKIYATPYNGSEEGNQKCTQNLARKF